MTPNHPVVSQLTIYPIKSCSGIQVNEAVVGSRGFQNDRRWMVVDSEGRFLTQRTHPKLSLLQTRMDKDTIEVSAPGMESIRLPQRPDGRATVNVTVWNDSLFAVPGPLEAKRWFSDVLQTTCQPVFMPDTAGRLVDRRYDFGGTPIGFADAFPFLLISEASLEDLNARLREPVPMNRFRPNIVLGRCQPYEEDTWKSFVISGIRFHVAKPCSRCVTTTVDQSTGVMGKEPLATLARYRGKDGHVFFGQNLVHAGSGRVRVGDPVEQ